MVDSRKRYRRSTTRSLDEKLPSGSGYVVPGALALALLALKGCGGEEPYRSFLDTPDGAALRQQAERDPQTAFSALKQEIKELNGRQGLELWYKAARQKTGYPVEGDSSLHIDLNLAEKALKQGDLPGAADSLNRFSSNIKLMLPNDADKSGNHKIVVHTVGGVPLEVETNPFIFNSLKTIADTAQAVASGFVARHAARQQSRGR